MPFSLPLPKPLRTRGWKVKIREKERCETPHVTVLFNDKTWRVSLLDLTFLDKEPKPRGVPKQIRELLKKNLATLQGKWNRKYPENPIPNPEDSNE